MSVSCGNAGDELVIACKVWRLFSLFFLVREALQGHQEWVPNSKRHGVSCFLMWSSESGFPDGADPVGAPATVVS